ncbi:MAG: restriction endonuclease subunit S, partial [Candidatus Aenigmarchaeota archaeon]|nr:restriction endonuclease subunit S [Candidatus Aenigmarchaeota archaeon]
MIEVKAGYKQTEIGVIPEDWDVFNLDKLSDRIGDGIHSTPKYSTDGDYFFINGNNLNNGIIEITADTKRVSKDEYLIHKKEINNTTVLLSINGTIGNIAFYNNENIILGKSAAYINLNNGLDKRYLYQIFQTEFIKKYFDNELTGSTIKNLGLGSIRNSPIPLPPTKSEQAAIATVLSDTDALIERLEKLIAKKIAIKQGTMQQLLTGKKRLPGFEMKKGYKQTELGIIPEDWDVISYGEAFDFLSTASYSRADLSENDEAFYVHYGDIHTTWNFFLDFKKHNPPTIEKIKVKNYSFIKDGDLIMADASEDYDGIGKSVEVKNITTNKAISGLHTFLLRGKEGIFVDGFKGYIHSNRFVKTSMDRLATGLKVYGVSKTNLKTIQIPRPTLPEQTAIATILSDMDTEIESLEQKRDKYTMIKQGMMQQLLTGRIRIHGT